MQKAFAAMAELEAGGIANPDENRMVGHYWLRNPALAPSADLRREIEQTVGTIKSFAWGIHNGSFLGAEGPFKNLLVIGIGGSALGRSLSPTPSASQAAIGWRLSSSITPTPMACKDSGAIGKRLGSDVVCGHFKIWRNAGNAQRDVGCQGGIPGRWIGLWPARSRNHRSRQQLGSTRRVRTVGWLVYRCGTGLADARARLRLSACSRLRCKALTLTRSFAAQGCAMRLHALVTLK